MGCFLGCFGFSGKRRRRKPVNKVLPGDHRHGSYEPLDSSVSVNFEIKENPISSDQLRNKIKEKSSNKIRKKVSFNLNVQTYEPLTNDETTYQLSESDEEEIREKNGEEIAEGKLCEGDSTAAKMNPFPTNHRYQNCIDSYDYEDDMAFVESDLDDEDEEVDEDEDYEDEDEYDINDQRISQSEFLKQQNSQSVELPERMSLVHLDEDKINKHIQIPTSTAGESKGNARDRSQFVNSVLNPVENLTQWKAIKARTAAPKHARKENIALQKEPTIPFGLETGSNLYPFNLAPKYNQSKPLLQEIAVDTSLSNWLTSPNCNESKATSIINTSRSISVERIPLKKSMFDRSCSWQSKEDTTILDITNLKT